MPTAVPAFKRLGLLGGVAFSRYAMAEMTKTFTLT